MSVYKSKRKSRYVGKFILEIYRWQASRFVRRNGGKIHAARGSLESRSINLRENILNSINQSSIAVVSSSLLFRAPREYVKIQASILLVSSGTWTPRCTQRRSPLKETRFAFGCIQRQEIKNEEKQSRSKTVIKSSKF